MHIKAINVKHKSKKKIENQNWKKLKHNSA